MRIAALQMLSGKNIEQNLDQAQTLLAEAAAQGCELALLPENFAVFGQKNLRAVAEAEQDGSGPISEFLASSARQYGIWLIGGTVPLLQARQPEQTPAGKVYAASTVWNPEGKLAARYDKCHLFDVDVGDEVGRYCESDTFAPGSEPVAVDVASWKVGLSVCYDLRFPEYYRLLSEQGANLITAPSAFTFATGRAHWELLLRARAVENQCYVLAADQGGEHSGKRVTWGHSCIIDPWGEVLAMRGEPGPGLVTAEISHTQLNRVRSAMPALMHRRF